ncbi:MAG: DUF4065 domain-containing protein [Deltaproteobacteria bacterium]|jgi:uncharacterized phage-associated protein|nr:DUF4065 domain-containing protein [Deltaproteobacteria bacterium]
MSTLYPAIAIANWLIEKNQSDNCGLTHLKIQKLLYFAQGFHLANLSNPLFEDDIEAWKYGPVVNAVYHALKRYDDDEIFNFIQGHYLSEGNLCFGKPKVELNDELTHKFLNIFWGNYSKIEPWKLVEMSHLSNGPWEQISQAIINKKTFSQVIPKELMKKYFIQFINKSSDNDR